MNHYELYEVIHERYERNSNESETGVVILSEL